MHIRRLMLTRFMRHAALDAVLPRSGIVTVAGDNGSGKSSLIEGVSFGLWGRTLRGTEPWAAETGGEVVVESDLVRATRLQRKGKVSLAWSHPDALDPEDFATTTKAQEALDTVIGAWDGWRKTHVFSSADASHFTLATDGERKRLLEELLALHAFDRALDACRGDLRQAQTRTVDASQRCDVLRAKVDSEDQRIRDAEALRAPAAGAPAWTEEDAEKARVSRVTIEQKLREGERMIRQLRAETAQIAEEAVQASCRRRSAESRVEQLAHGACPTCGQAIAPEVIASLRTTFDKAATEANLRRVESRDAADRVAAEVTEIEEEQSSLHATLSTLIASLRSWDADVERRRRLAALETDATQKRARLVERLRETEADLAKAKASAAVLEAVAAVLGLRGVRTQVLARTLAGLEKAANLYLARIAGPGIRLRLRSFVEKKSGGIADAIGLDVEGAGGGRGYRAASGGERRRIDVALLLALAEIAAGARGTEPGTLFFDEVFDSLDEEGIDAVAGVLEDLAKHRAIVVISHSQTLADRLPGTHWRIVDGRIEA